MVDIIEKQQSALADFYNVHLLTEFIVRICGDLINLKNEHGFLHNEVQLRRWIAYKVPKMSNRHCLILNQPIRSLSRLNLVYNFKTDDIEYLSAES